MIKLASHYDPWGKSVKFTPIKVPLVASHTQPSWHIKVIRL